MIYECDYCCEQVGPHACSCPRCGQEFDVPVPADAAPAPERPWPLQSKDQVKTIVLGKSLPPRRTHTPPPGLLQKLQEAIAGRLPRIL